MEKQSDVKSFTKKLNHLIENLTKPDGNKYTPEEITVFTNGVISTSHLRKLINGQASNPTYDVINALSKFFCIDAGYWFSDEEEILEYQKTDHKLLIAKRSLAVVTQHLSEKSVADVEKAVNKVAELESENE